MRMHAFSMHLIRKNRKSIYNGEQALFSIDISKLKKMESFNRQIYNIILIHTARTWERIRLKQPFQEMPHDNIASTDYIEGIA